MTPTTVKLANEYDFRLEHCIVRPAQYLILDGQNAVRIEPRVMQVLVLLCRRSGQVVGRDELMQSCWGDIVVGEDALNRCIQRLRASLRDLKLDGIRIETIPRVGYSLKVDRPGTIVPLPAAAVVASVAEKPAMEPPIPPEMPPADRQSPLSPAAEPVPAPTVADPWRAGRLRSLVLSLAGLILAILVAGALLWPRAPASLPGAWTVARAWPVTAEPGRDLSPALSPDGGLLTYSRSMGGGQSLWTRSVSGNVPIPAATPAAYDRAAVWSPQGGQIAFVRRVHGETCRLMLSAGLGGHATEVARCQAAEDSTLDWTADGGALIFSDAPDALAPRRLYRLDLSDGTVRPLTTPAPDSWGHEMPAVSPDGRRVAFLSMVASSANDLVLLDLTDGSLRPLTDDGARIDGLAWLRSGDLVFSSNRTGDRALWSLRPGASGPVRLATAGGEYGRVSGARFSDRIAVEVRQQRAQLRAVGGPAAPRPRTQTQAVDSTPALAADGSLAFISNRTGAPELWLAPPGEEPRQFTTLRSPHVWTPRFAPDGRTVAFAASTGGNVDIFLVDRAGGAPRRLTRDRAEDLAPVWSPDGTALFFVSRRSGAWRIWRMPVDDPDAAVAVTGDGPMSARIDPDGRWLFFVVEGKAGIWRQPLEAAAGSPAQLVVPDLDPVDWLNWDVTLSAIHYVVRPAGGGAEIRRADLDGGSVQTVADAAHLPWWSGLAAAPDGAEVVHADLLMDESDIHLMELTRP